MNKSWKIIYYEDIDEKSDVFHFIEKLKDNNKAKVFSWLSLLEEKGPLLPRPYADLLKDGIHEIRIKLSGNQVRILFFFCYEDFIVLTNCFIKNTKKVSENHIIKALKCKEDFLRRFTEIKLREVYNENI